MVWETSGPLKRGLNYTAGTELSNLFQNSSPRQRSSCWALPISSSVSWPNLRLTLACYEMILGSFLKLKMQWRLRFHVTALQRGVKVYHWKHRRFKEWMNLSLLLHKNTLVSVWRTLLLGRTQLFNKIYIIYIWSVPALWCWRRENRAAKSILCQYVGISCMSVH